MKVFHLSGFSDEASSDLTTQIKVLKENSIEYIEIRGVGNKNIVYHSLDDIKSYKKLLDENNIKVSSIGSPIGKVNVTDNFDEHVKLFNKTLEVAKMLDSKYIRIFSFYIPDNEDPSNYRNQVFLKLKCLSALAKKAGIILLHENEKNIYGDNPQRCYEISQQFSDIKVVFDPANYVQCEIEPYPYAYNLLKPYIEYVHIKDAKYDGINVPPGEGDAKIEEILLDLKKHNYDGFISLEPHLGYFKGLSDLEPNRDFKGMQDSSTEKFNLAVKSLKIILEKIKTD